MMGSQAVTWMAPLRLRLIRGLSIEKRLISAHRTFYVVFNFSGLFGRLIGKQVSIPKPLMKRKAVVAVHSSPA